MHSKFWFVIGLIACLGIVVGSYFWATAVMDSQYAYRSPLKDSPPQPGEPPGEQITRRVVFVLIDALRTDTAFNRQVMPTLNQLRDQAAWGQMKSQPPSYSEPGYTVLLTGAWPYLSDGPTFNLEYEEIPTWTQDNLFSAAHRIGLKTAISGYYWFEKLVPQQAVDYSFYTPGEDAQADRQVVDAALPWMREGSASLVLIHLDQVDYAGHHQGGPRDPRWDEAARRADDLLREIAATLDLEADTLLVVSDHGQIDRGGHGGNEPEVLFEPFVLLGAGVIPGEYEGIQMVDVAPTLAVLLGTNLPASSQGFPLVEMLNLNPEQTLAIQSALAEQQTRLSNAVLDAIGQPAGVVVTTANLQAGQEAIQQGIQARLREERRPRWLLALALGLLPVAFFVLKRGEKLTWLFTGGGFYFIFFHLGYSLIGGRTYSLSSVRSPEDIIFFTLITAAVSLVLGWLVVVLRLGLFRQPPGEAAGSTLGMVWMSLYITAVPVLVSYALNGIVVTWTLPDYITFYQHFLALLQALAIGALGPLLTGLAALIAWRRRAKGA